MDPLHCGRSAAAGDEKEQPNAAVFLGEEGEDRTPPLALLTQYLAITYKHCRPQQQQQQDEDAADTESMRPHWRQQPCSHAANSGRNATADESRVVPVASRRILTKKGEPAANNGLDNEDRNLIVRVRDVLADDGTTQSFVKVSGQKTGHTARYIVLDLLGQGTFGQVFRCQHAATKDIVAVKVIRNHPSYYKQAIVEVQVTRMLNRRYRGEQSQHLVRLHDTFECKNHLCLVFELLSMNVYELIAENNFRGFPLDVTQGFLRQMLHALAQLSEAGVIHCDLKPENILLAGPDLLFEAPTARHQGSQTCNQAATPLLKVVDFGSACLENETVYSYIQSRFYRSPEVLLGIPYNGAIDMWSLGCIAFELLLGLPLFPGVSEHDQLRLIEETLGELPQHLLKKGRNVLKFYDVRIRQHATNFESNEEFVLKSPEQFAKETKSAVRVSKKYFKYSKLDDMISAYPFHDGLTPSEFQCECERRHAFIHFLKGLLTVDPAARWTASDALQHPFITGERFILEEFSPAVNQPCGAEMPCRENGRFPGFAYQQSYYVSPEVLSQMSYGYAQPVMPMHQRVCPIVTGGDSYYGAAASDRYCVGPVYYYEQPWIPPRFPARSQMGDPGFTNEQQNIASYDCNLLQPPSVPAHYWNPPQYEPAFDPPASQCAQNTIIAPQQQMTQKVAPVPTGSVVVPTPHSPLYYTFPYTEFPFYQNSNTYDAQVPHALDRPHGLGNTSVDPQVFRTPPKARQHHHHRQQHQQQATNPISKSVSRPPRRRRPTQQKFQDTGLSLSSLVPPAYSQDTVEAEGGDARYALLVDKKKPSGLNHQQTHKRRNEDDDTRNGSNDIEIRAWKSPRSSTESSIIHPEAVTNHCVKSTTT
ncbi:Cmgc/dyrk/dyrk2 protein kinase, partial [Globisporangium splendens]